MINLQDIRGNHRIIIVAGSGKSIDLLPDSLFQSCFIISLNWSFVYVPESNKNHICFCSDMREHHYRHAITMFNLKPPENILTKYDLTQKYTYSIDKDLNSIASSLGSGFRGLDLAYKLNPEIIVLAGIDLQGGFGKKVESLNIARNNYDNKEINWLLGKEAQEITKAMERMESEGIKTINISPYSRLPQTMSIEDFINDFNITTIS